MSLSLAPYNNAMRLGMGFNSYTQQLCINDAVVKPNNVKPKEKDLKVAGIDISVGKFGSTTVHRKFSGVSQTVTSTSRFVDRFSEVTDAMNISGSLEIKHGALGGKGSRSFVDSNKFLSSDVRLFIQVKVINQILEADDVTEFNPIKELPPSEFMKVFGDSFISGYVSGGEFNALVMWEIMDKSKVHDIKAKAMINLNSIPTFDVEAQNEVEKGESLDENSKTTISVAWSGGESVKDDNTTDWSVEGLKKAAIAFPNKVAEAPQRTHAIITKYTSLRSYQASKNKGNVLDYQNTGLYTSALLDDYVDYKAIWTRLQNAAFDVNHHGYIITGKSNSSELENNTPKLKSSNDETPKSRQGEEAQFEGDTQLTDDGSTSSFESIKEPDNLAETNAPERCSDCLTESKAVAPYAPTLPGINKALCECRCEMIKIVQEVDAIAQNPMLAADPIRANMYLPPTVFNMRTPIAVSPAPKTTPQEIEITELKKKLQDQGTELDRITEEKDKLKAQADILNHLTTSICSVLPRSLQDTISRYRGLSNNYQMSFIAGDMDLTREGPKVFNDCDSLNMDDSPRVIHIFKGNHVLTGVKVTHWNGRVLESPLVHRIPASEETFTLQEGEKVVRFRAEASYKPQHNISLVDAIRLETDRGRVFDVACSTRSPTGKNSRTESAPDTNFGLKGFWGQSGDAIDRLGCVWGKY